jgi:hypothetical protein
MQTLHSYHQLYQIYIHQRSHLSVSTSLAGKPCTTLLSLEGTPGLYQVGGPATKKEVVEKVERKHPLPSYGKEARDMVIAEPKFPAGSVVHHVQP